MALQKGIHCLRTIDLGCVFLRSLPGRRGTHGVDNDPKAGGLEALQGFFGSSNGLTKGGIAMLTDRPVQIDNDDPPGRCVVRHHRSRHAPNRTGWNKGATLFAPLHTRWLGVRVPFGSCSLSHRERPGVRGFSHLAKLIPTKTTVTKYSRSVNASYYTLYCVMAHAADGPSYHRAPSATRTAAMDHQFSNPGFCFLHPASEGKMVVMAKRWGSPSNQSWTVSRHFW